MFSLASARRGGMVSQEGKQEPDHDGSNKHPEECKFYPKSRRRRSRICISGGHWDIISMIEIQFCVQYG